MASTINAESTGVGGIDASGDASGVLALQTGGTTALTIDASQNVGINCIPNMRLITGNKTEIYAGALGTTAGNIVAAQLLTSSDSNSTTLQTFGYRVSTGSSHSTSEWRTQRIVDATRMGYLGYGSNYISFGQGTTEQMRIDSSGNVLVGTTTISGYPTTNAISLRAQYGDVLVAHPNGTASTTTYMQFAYNGGGIGTITQNGTTGVLYNLTSDYRLKNNPTALTGASDFIMALQPKTWDWWDGSGKGVGFIAHEFMEVAKHSGNGEKDEVDAEGKPVMQSIQPSSSEVMANLVSFVQELKAIIDTQNARIEALEAK